MDRLGGVERLHEQIYSAVTTQRRESLDMALMAFGEVSLHLKPPQGVLHTSLTY